MQPNPFGLILSTLLMAVLVVGCATAETTVDPAQVTDLDAPVERDESSGVKVEELVPQTMVAQVQALSDEIRSLRDQVEILENELDATKQRQMDLYNDLDNRLRRFERGVPSNNENPDSSTGETSSSAEPASDAESTESADGAELSGEGAESTVEMPLQEPEEVVDPEVIRAAYDNAFRTLRQGKYEDSILEFNALVQNYPQSDLVDDALYWIAEANYVTKKYEIALMGFEQIIRDYPDNRRAAEAMLKIGYIYYDQQDFEQAANYLQEVMERYPASRSAFSANRRLNKMRRDGDL